MWLFVKSMLFTVDFRNSKASPIMISTALVILRSLGGNIWQFNRNGQLKGMI